VSQSHIDVTFITESQEHTVRDWKVSEVYRASLHRYILFDLTSDTRPSPEKRWFWRKFDRSKLREFLHGKNKQFTFAKANRRADAVDKLLAEACDACMPRGTYKGGKKSAFW